MVLKKLIWVEIFFCPIPNILYAWIRNLDAVNFHAIIVRLTQQGFIKKIQKKKTVLYYMHKYVVSF